MLVFPAHAGMSRESQGFCSVKRGFPRPRGDEPDAHTHTNTPTKFSPPTRG